MSAKVYGVAVVGAGNIAAAHIDAVSRLPNARVTGVASLGQGSMTGASAYAQAEWFATPSLTAYFGLRYDRYRTRGRVAQSTPPAFDLAYPDRSFDAWSPKAALSWRVSPGVALRASYGVGFRPPSLFDLYSRYASPSAIAGVAQVNEPAPDLEAEHIEAVDEAIDEVARVLVPGGRFAFFLNHPLLQTPGSGWIDDQVLDPPEQYWRIGPYLDESVMVEEVAKDVHLPYVHRPLSRYVNALVASGLIIREMLEPPPPPGFLALAPEYLEARSIPRLLFLHCERERST